MTDKVTTVWKIFHPLTGDYKKWYSEEYVMQEVEKRLQIAITTLKWYASKYNYSVGYCKNSNANNDNGELARKTLAKLGVKDGE